MCHSNTSLSVWMKCLRLIMWQVLMWICVRFKNTIFEKIRLHCDAQLLLTLHWPPWAGGWHETDNTQGEAYQEHAMFPAGACRWQAQYLGSPGDPWPSPGLSSSCHAGAVLSPTLLPSPQRSRQQSPAPAHICLSCIVQWLAPYDLQEKWVIYSYLETMY